MAKAKADHSAMKTLKTALRVGEPKTLYLFHGEEAYLRDYYLGELKKALLPQGLEEFNLKVLSGKDVNPTLLGQTIDCLPMMSERTLVLVYDYDLYKASEGDRTALMALFDDLPDYLCLVFVYDLIEYKPDARTKLAAALKARCEIVDFARQEQGDLVDWICRRFRATGHDMDSQLARHLIFLCGDLMNTLASEIGKISAYAKNPRITQGDIDAVATPQLDAVVFQMTDAISQKNYDGAAAVMGELFHMQQSPIMILSVLGKHLRQLYVARLALEHKKTADFVATTCGMHPYPAGKLYTAARQVTLPWCRQALVRAGQTDQAMKSGGGDGDDLLVTLLLELAHG